MEQNTEPKNKPTHIKKIKQQQKSKKKKKRKGQHHKKWNLENWTATRKTMKVDPPT